MAERKTKNRRFSRRMPMLIVFFVICVLIISLWPRITTHSDSIYFQVMPYSVNDGDTFRARVKGVDERIRLIGVDTPEMNDKTFAEEAAAAQEFSASLIDRQSIWIEVDLNGERDQYGRILAYVWLVDPSTVKDKKGEIADKTLNGRLLSEGFAKALTIEPNTKYAAVFEELAAQAQENGVGLWPSGVFD